MKKILVISTICFVLFSLLLIGCSQQPVVVSKSQLPAEYAGLEEFVPAGIKVAEYGYLISNTGCRFLMYWVPEPNKANHVFVVTDSGSATSKILYTYEQYKEKAQSEAVVTKLLPPRT